VQRRTLGNLSLTNVSMIAVLFLVLFASLHFLKPELDPSWQRVSEFANAVTFALIFLLLLMASN
jgi:hypothetical protein